MLRDKLQKGTILIILNEYTETYKDQHYDMVQKWLIITAINETLTN